MEKKNLSDFEKFTLKLEKKMKLVYPTHNVDVASDSVAIYTDEPDEHTLICKYNNKQKVFFAFCTENGIKVDSLDDGMNMVFKFCKTWKFMQGFE
tara:strand:- start:3992 stop:4276 length:285 start_codon:yes stop_codon:yes gene_type:complete